MLFFFFTKKQNKLLQHQTVITKTSERKQKFISNENDLNDNQMGNTKKNGHITRFAKIYNKT